MAACCIAQRCCHACSARHPEARSMVATAPACSLLHCWGAHGTMSLVTMTPTMSCDKLAYMSRRRRQIPRGAGRHQERGRKLRKSRRRAPRPPRPSIACLIASCNPSFQKYYCNLSFILLKILGPCSNEKQQLEAAAAADGALLFRGGTRLPLRSYTCPRRF